MRLENHLSQVQVEMACALAHHFGLPWSGAMDELGEQAFDKASLGRYCGRRLQFFDEKSGRITIDYRDRTSLFDFRVWPHGAAVLWLKRSDSVLVEAVVLSAGVVSFRLYEETCNKIQPADIRHLRPPVAAALAQHHNYIENPPADWLEASLRWLDTALERLNSVVFGSKVEWPPYTTWHNSSVEEGRPIITKGDIEIGLIPGTMNVSERAGLLTAYPDQGVRVFAR